MAEGPNIIINQPKALLDEMDEWNQNQHGSSGLIDGVKKSAVTDQMAEIETLEFISKYVGPKQSPMCGNTVSHDRRFLIKYMPRLESYFNYRHIDVSSFKEAAVRWMNEAQVYEKHGSHRAMGDIKDSVGELKFYKDLFLPDEYQSWLFAGWIFKGKGLTWSLFFLIFASPDSLTSSILIIAFIGI